MALTSSQKRKARQKLARKRGVSESSISDTDLTLAITAGIILASDYSDSGSSYSGSSDFGSSYSSSDTSGY